ncbi:unnamed protein product [Rangifer tarandus platyrhynchus]|uniref:Uncharacterized protein n=2 Tax=Rangifer tarandus platyrhynchus TaxID=3082113 RepID=A0AC60A4U9_RANTA|nr:unnamed protein product [Rangifer tarandus platyrhynchus]
MLLRTPLRSQRCISCYREGARAHQPQHRSFTAMQRPERGEEKGTAHRPAGQQAGRPWVREPQAWPPRGAPPSGAPPRPLARGQRGWGAGARAHSPLRGESEGLLPPCPEGRGLTDAPTGEARPRLLQGPCAEARGAQGRQQPAGRASTAGEGSPFAMGREQTDPAPHRHPSPPGGGGTGPAPALWTGAPGLGGASP